MPTKNWTPERRARRLAQQRAAYHRKGDQRREEMRRRAARNRRVAGASHPYRAPRGNAAMAQRLREFGADPALQVARKRESVAAMLMEHGDWIESIDFLDSDLVDTRSW